MFDRSCLNEAEYLAGLTPVRLDLLLSLVPPGANLLPDEAAGNNMAPQTSDIKEAIILPEGDGSKMIDKKVVRLINGVKIHNTTVPFNQSLGNNENKY